MKTVVCTRYGPPEVLVFREVEKPSPQANEILVRIHATTVTRGDVRMRSFTVPLAMWIPARLFLGIRKPKRDVLGMELAGTVEAVGRDVTRFKPGDPIFASTTDIGFGGYAEYKCLPEDAIVAMKPTNLTYPEAAAVVGGSITALICLKQANIQPGQQVLIYGTSGAVGSSAVQIAAHHYGASVTAVCSSRNLGWVKTLGAETMIDYTQEDFTQHGQTYDVVFDAVAKVSPACSKKVLKPGGTYLNVHKDSDAESKPEQLRQTLQTVKALVEEGKLKPVIDRCYPLEDIVQAHRYVDQGHKQGSVAITVVSNTYKTDFRR